MSRSYIASDVQWHHAVNRRQRLTTVLVECQSHPETPCMLEVDVTRGTILGSATSTAPQPILAHPPETKGDLSFAEFIDLISEHVKGRPGYYQQERAQTRASFESLGGEGEKERKRRSQEIKATEEIPEKSINSEKSGGSEKDPGSEKDASFEKDSGSEKEPERATHGLAGIKLDFKNPVILHPCLKYLKQKISANELSGIEIWLNADILQGPGGKSPDFHPDEFVDICRDYVPSAKLSLGYTHGSFWEGKYSKAMIDQMLELCKKHSLQNVTFALNAVVAKNSPEAKRLVVPSEGNDQVLAYSLTLWGDADRKLKEWMASSLDPMRTFIDVQIPSSMLFSMKKGLQGLSSKRPWSMTMLDLDDKEEGEGEEGGDEEGEEEEAGDEEQPLENGEATTADAEEHDFEPEGGDKIQ